MNVIVSNLTAMFWPQCTCIVPSSRENVETGLRQTHTHMFCAEKKWQQCGTLGKRPLVMLQVDRLLLSYPKSEGGKLEKNAPVLRSGHKDSCLSHSAKGLNVKCKHNHRFQKTVIASLFFRNVDHSNSQTGMRQMIFSTVLTDYTHTTLKCPGSCCSHSLRSFTFLTQEKNWKCVCTTITVVHWSRTVLSWFQVVTVDKCDKTAVGVLRNRLGRKQTNKKTVF